MLTSQSELLKKVIKTLFSPVLADMQLAVLNNQWWYVSKKDHRMKSVFMLHFDGDT
jgi:hypothetical protein